MNSSKTQAQRDSSSLFRAVGRLALLLAATAVWSTAPAQQAPWAVKPVHIVVGYPPGGSADTTARLLSDRLARRIGQAVIVENRPGAGGRIGALSVVKAEPDGYTLLLGAPSEITIAPATVRDMPFDSLRDLQPVTTLVSGSFMLISSNSVPANTVAELVAHAKAHPGKINFASFGNNTTNHLYGEQFNAAAGIASTHVPYKGGAPAWNDLMTGNIQFMFENAAVAMPYVRAGKIKALAVLSPQRLPMAPGVPTMAEAGYPDIGMRSWLGLFAPAKTPAATVRRLHEDVAAVLADPDLARQLDERGAPASVSTPEEFSRALKTEIDAWKSIVSRLGLRLD